MTDLDSHCSSRELARWQSRAISGAQSRAITEHLLICESCRYVVQTLNALWTAMDDPGSADLVLGTAPTGPGGGWLGAIPATVRVYLGGLGATLIVIVALVILSSTPHCGGGSEPVIDDATRLTVHTDDSGRGSGVHNCTSIEVTPRSFDAGRDDVGDARGGGGSGGGGDGGSGNDDDEPRKGSGDNETKAGGDRKDSIDGGGAIDSGAIDSGATDGGAIDSALDGTVDTPIDTSIDKPVDSPIDATDGAVARTIGADASVARPPMLKVQVPASPTTPTGLTSMNLDKTESARTGIVRPQVPPIAHHTSYEECEAACRLEYPPTEENP